MRIFGLQEDGKIVALCRHRKLIRGIVRAQSVTGLNVLFDLQSERLEHFRQSARGTLGYPGELRRILLRRDVLIRPTKLWFVAQDSPRFIFADRRWRGETV